jgi:hypothetical protein
LQRNPTASDARIGSRHQSSSRGDDGSFCASHSRIIPGFSDRNAKISDDILTERATRVIGFVDAQIAGFGSLRQYTERQEYQRIAAILRNAVPAHAFGGLSAEGASITHVQAIEEARLALG